MEISSGKKPLALWQLCARPDRFYWETWRSFDKPANTWSALSILVAILTHSSGLHQSHSKQWAMSLVQRLARAMPQVPALPLEISYLLLFLVFPQFWPESCTMHFPLSLCEQSPAMVFHPLCESPEASSDMEQQEFLHPQSWHWFFRHLAAQRTQPAAVLTHFSLLQSQSHPNWSVLQHHCVCQPELPFTFHLPA